MHNDNSKESLAFEFNGCFIQFTAICLLNLEKIKRLTIQVEYTMCSTVLYSHSPV